MSKNALLLQMVYPLILNVREIKYVLNCQRFLSCCHLLEADVLFTLYVSLIPTDLRVTRSDR